MSCLVDLMVNYSEERLPIVLKVFVWSTTWVACILRAYDRRGSCLAVVCCRMTLSSELSSATFTVYSTSDSGLRR